MFTFLFSCSKPVSILGILGIFLSGPSFADVNAPSSHFDFFSSVGSGPFLLPSFPRQTQIFPQFQVDTLFRCRSFEACDRYQISFLRAHFDFTLSNSPYVEESRFLLQDGSSPEHHIPSLTFKLRTFEIRPTPNFYVSFLNLELSRATRILDESINSQFTAALFSVQFGKRKHGPFEGRCSFGMAGPGVKSIEYISNSTPFQGLYILGFEQSCGFAIGNRTFQASLSYALQSALQIGQSGAGNAMTHGSFGAINSESRLTFEAGVWIRSPQVLQQIGILAFTIQAPVSLRYHINRGCLQEIDQSSPTCSNETNGLELRIPLMFGVILGPLPHDSSIATSVIGPYAEPYMTPSKGL